MTPDLFLRFPVRGLTEVCKRDELQLVRFYWLDFLIILILRLAEWGAFGSLSHIGQKDENLDIATTIQAALLTTDEQP